MKQRRLTALLLALVTIVSVMIVPVSALSSDVHDILFDWEYYYANNSDVAKAFGRNPDALRRHYENHGKAEGRAPSVLFDPKIYLGLYNDLKNAFGTNYIAAYNHFVSHGISEGRQGSSHFSVAVYKANYADLRNAFGGSNLLYLKHFREFGAREGREAVKKLPVSATTQTLTNALYKINISSSKITCGFDGYVELRNKYGYRHEGIDFGYAKGKPVYSLTDGVVTKVTPGSSSALSTVAIYYKEKDVTVVYLHLAPAIAEKQTVSKGTMLGTEAARGANGAIHTHVEVRQGYHTSAAKSKDTTLVNSNPSSFWESLGYIVK